MSEVAKELSAVEEEEEIEETRSRSSAAELWAEVDGAVGTYVFLLELWVLS